MGDLAGLRHVFELIPTIYFLETVFELGNSYVIINFQRSFLK